MASNSSPSESAPPAPQDASVPNPTVENPQPVAVEAVPAVEGVQAAQPVAVEPVQPVPPVEDEYSDEAGDDTDDSGEGAAPGKELTEDQKYAREVRQKWRNMTSAELRETMAKPVGAAELVRNTSQMHEEQLQIIAPYMTDSQIASTIPSLQLQQQNALVLGFNASQVRQAVRAIPVGDRQILAQNVTLITASEADPSKDEEVQGIIGFIDPLAMAVAVERPELVDKVIRATCIMTPDQIRVMVPLVPLAQVRTMIETIVSAESLAIVMEMLLPEQRSELVTQCQNDLAEVESSLRKVSADVTAWADTKMPELSRLVYAFCNKPLTSLATNEHATLASRLMTAKTQLERCHRETRNMRKKIKLPLAVLPAKDSTVASTPSTAKEAEKEENTKPKEEEPEKLSTEASMLKSFLHIQEELTKLGKTISAQYAILDNTGDSNHGLMHKLHDTWAKFQAEQGPAAPGLKSATEASAEEPHEGNSISKEEQMYVDSDLSTALYFAVQTIGNPSAIGDIYNFTWNDIIDLGFRSADDFSAKGVTNLKQLETLIHKHKGIATPNSPAESVPAAE